MAAALHSTLKTLDKYDPILSGRMTDLVGKVSRAKDHQLCTIIVIAVVEDFDQCMVTLGYLLS